MTRQLCDDVFEREEKAFWRAGEKLLGAAQTCIRQAARDLSRACGLFKDADVSRLRAHLVENLAGLGNFDNIKEACQLFTSGRRSNLSSQISSPEDLLTISALNLKYACQHLLSQGVDGLPLVGPDTVRS